MATSGATAKRLGDRSWQRMNTGRGCCLIANCDANVRYNPSHGEHADECNIAGSVLSVSMMSLKLTVRKGLGMEIVSCSV